MKHEYIVDAKHNTLAIVIPKDVEFHDSKFISSVDSALQIGFQFRGGSNPVKAHHHPRYKREIDITWEVLYFFEGSAKCSIFDSEANLVEILTCTSGDFLILLAGGHSIDFSESTKILEFKQGPYFANKDKIFMHQNDLL